MSAVASRSIPLTQTSTLDFEDGCNHATIKAKLRTGWRSEGTPGMDSSERARLFAFDHDYYDRRNDTCSLTIGTK